MEQGYIKLFRRLMESHLWNEKPFSRGQAWVDLLFLTNYGEGSYWLRGIKIEVERGQCSRSQAKFAERWGWSRGKVRRFFEYLVKHGKVVQQNVQQNGQENKYLTTLTTIVNYEQYQGDGQQDEQQNGQQTDSRRTADGTVKKKNKKNKKEDKDIYGEFQNVKLLKAEHQKLVKGYGKQITGEMTERLSAYVASSGKRYSSHYATILGWLRNDGVDPLRECKATDPMPDQVQNKNKWTHPDLVQVRNSVTGKTGKKCRHCEIVFER